MQRARLAMASGLLLCAALFPTDMKIRRTDDFLSGESQIERRKITYQLASPADASLALLALQVAATQNQSIDIYLTLLTSSLLAISFMLEAFLYLLQNPEYNQDDVPFILRLVIKCSTLILLMYVFCSKIETTTRDHPPFHHNFLSWSRMFTIKSKSTGAQHSEIDGKRVGKIHPSLSKFNAASNSCADTSEPVPNFDVQSPPYSNLGKEKYLAYHSQHSKSNQESGSITSREASSQATRQSVLSQEFYVPIQAQNEIAPNFDTTTEHQLVVRPDKLTSDTWHLSESSREKKSPEYSSRRPLSDCASSGNRFDHNTNISGVSQTKSNCSSTATEPMSGCANRQLFHSSASESGTPLSQEAGRKLTSRIKSTIEGRTGYMPLAGVSPSSNIAAPCCPEQTDEADSQSNDDMQTARNRRRSRAEARARRMRNSQESMPELL